MQPLLPTVFSEGLLWKRTRGGVLHWAGWVTHFCFSFPVYALKIFESWIWLAINLCLFCARCHAWGSQPYQGELIQPRPAGDCSVPGMYWPHPEMAQGPHPGSLSLSWGKKTALKSLGHTAEWAWYEKWAQKLQSASRRSSTSAPAPQLLVEAAARGLWERVGWEEGLGKQRRHTHKPEGRREKAVKH